MALSPPAKHRKVWYRVANSLGAEDRKSITFLLDINEVDSGIDLFRILESKRYITANDPYNQLVPLLHDVGRNDLITEICVMDPSACGQFLRLEYHQSFSGNEQLARMKRCLILCKRDEYIFCTKELKEVRSCIQSRRVCCEGLFNPIFSQITLQPDSLESQIVSMQVKSVENAISALSLFWQMWPTALARFQGTCSSLKIKHLMEQCHQQYDQFCDHTKLDCASEIHIEVQRSQEKSNHPIGQVARKVHHVLDEISSEMFGNQKMISTATSTTKNAIFIVESLNYTTKYILPIFKWLSFLLHAVGLGKLNVQSIRNTLESVISDHKMEIESNWEAISSILGDHLASKLRDLIPVTSATQNKDKECTGNAYDGLIYTYLTETLGIVWYVVLIILAGAAAGRVRLFSDEFTIQQLQEKIFQYLNFHKHKLVHVHQALSIQMGNSMQQEIQMFKGHLVEVVRMLANGQPDSAKLMESIFEEDQDEEIP
jgi:hypothetical protein